jgi:hypothetical protein
MQIVTLEIQGTHSVNKVGQRWAQIVLGWVSKGQLRWVLLESVGEKGGYSAKSV